MQIEKYGCVHFDAEFNEKNFFELLTILTKNVQLQDLKRFLQKTQLTQTPRTQTSRIVLFLMLDKFVEKKLKIRKFLE